MLKKTVFYEVCSSIKKHPKNFLFIALFHLLFFGAIYAVAQLFTSILKGITPSLISLIILFILFIAYILLLLFLYSFFKYCIIDFVSSFIKKWKYGFRRLGRFYLLNISIFPILIVLFLAIHLILSYAFGSFYKYIALVFFVLFAFFSYAFMNIAHSLFIDETRDIIKKATKITFKKIKNYIPVYLSSILFIATYTIIIFIIGSIAKYAIIKDSVSRYAVYFQIYSFLTFIVVLAIFSFNNIYFYFILKKRIEKR